MQRTLSGRQRLCPSTSATLDPPSASTVKRPSSVAKTMLLIGEPPRCDNDEGEASVRSGCCGCMPSACERCSRAGGKGARVQVVRCAAVLPEPLMAIVADYM